MSDFKSYKLKDVCSKIGSGATPRGGKESYLNHGEIFLIRSQNVLDFLFSTEGVAYISPEQARLLDGVKIDKNDVLINITGDSVARVCSVPKFIQEARVNQHVAILRANPKLLSNVFLKYYLLQPQIKTALLTISYAGATRKALTKSDLEDFNIDLPELPYQHRIAEILGALDDKIELNRQMNHTLEQMAQALYRHYFVDDIDPENLPEGWRNGVLDEVVYIRGGGTPSTKESKFWNGSIHWTSPKDLANLRSPFLTDTESKLTVLGIKKVSSGLLPQETVLLSSRAPIGYIAIADIPVAINQGYIAILPDSIFGRLFMYFWLKNNMDLIIQYANGSTFLEISKKAFREIECIIPTNEKIQKFIVEVKSQFDLIKSNTYETEHLIKSRDYLLPKLISGELTPSDLQPIEQAL